MDPTGSDGLDRFPILSHVEDSRLWTSDSTTPPASGLAPDFPSNVEGDDVRTINPAVLQMHDYSRELRPEQQQQQQLLVWGGQLTEPAQPSRTGSVPLALDGLGATRDAYPTTPGQGGVATSVGINAFPGHSGGFVSYSELSPGVNGRFVPGDYTASHARNDLAVPKDAPKDDLKSGRKAVSRRKIQKTDPRLPCDESYHHQGEDDDDQFAPMFTYSYNSQA
ncbi:hypothetical protein F4803DRAFT_557221 [Xylaria telfairii]|nr:hypothetical protein F4803DRAFT_557221 [Xylaria telfairii]